MCVKHPIALSTCKGEESEKIRSLLIIALDNETVSVGGVEEELWHRNCVNCFL